MIKAWQLERGQGGDTSLPKRRAEQSRVTVPSGQGFRPWGCSTISGCQTLPWVLLLWWPPASRGFSKLSPKWIFHHCSSSSSQGWCPFQLCPVSGSQQSPQLCPPTMDGVDSVLFNKNNNFLLSPAAGRGGGRLEAVHCLAQLDPAVHRSGLLQPGHLQEASGISRGWRRAAPSPSQQEQGFHGITRWLMLEGASGGQLVHISAPAEPQDCAETDF